MDDFSSRWIVAARLIDHPVKRARQRYVVNYRLMPTLKIGVEWNPGADEVGPLVNWLAMTETRTRPALMLGTSSDRIGTPDGQAYFVTLSKGLGAIGRFPIAGYVGATHGTFEDETRPIAGVTADVANWLRTRVMYDGENTHAALETSVGRHDFGLLLIDGEYVGATWSVTF